MVSLLCDAKESHAGQSRAESPLEGSGEEGEGKEEASLIDKSTEGQDILPDAVIEALQRQKR